MALIGHADQTAQSAVHVFRLGAVGIGPAVIEAEDVRIRDPLGDIGHVGRHDVTLADRGIPAVEALLPAVKEDDALQRVVPQRGHRIAVVYLNRRPGVGNLIEQNALGIDKAEAVDQIAIVGDGIQVTHTQRHALDRFVAGAAALFEVEDQAKPLS